MITRFIDSVAEPQFLLARDLMALAIADGDVTDEERKAISHICNMEGVNEIDFFNSLQEKNDNSTIEMPQTRKEKEDYLKKLILLIGADEYCSPEEAYLFQIVASKIAFNEDGSATYDLTLRMSSDFTLNDLSGFLESQEGVREIRCELGK